MQGQALSNETYLLEHKQVDLGLIAMKLALKNLDGSLKISQQNRVSKVLLRVPMKKLTEAEFKKKNMNRSFAMKNNVYSFLQGYQMAMKKSSSLI